MPDQRVTCGHQQVCQTQHWHTCAQNRRQDSVFGSTFAVHLLARVLCSQSGLDIKQAFTPFRESMQALPE